MSGLHRFAEPGNLLSVRVTPNASREQVTLDGDRFLIRVTCPPEDGKANRAVARLLAKTIGVAPSRLTLLKGQTGRDKLFRLD